MGHSLMNRLMNQSQANRASKNKLRSASRYAQAQHFCNIRPRRMQSGACSDFAEPSRMSVERSFTKLAFSVFIGNYLLRSRKELTINFFSLFFSFFSFVLSLFLLDAKMRKCENAPESNAEKLAYSAEACRISMERSFMKIRPM